MHTYLVAILVGFSAFLTRDVSAVYHGHHPHVPCKNGPTSRGCWGKYSIDTNWYEQTPYTGVTREYWLVAENKTLAPDGFEEIALVINGSIPGPTLYADWGDELVIHVTNKMQDNGTTLHWHGIRQLHNNENDGVPGVTQCPIAPGETYTYRWRATQYGTSWYHSHFSSQYSDGMQGAIIINGPATANYDEDLGSLILQDWGHNSTFSEWYWDRPVGGPPNQANALINGTNVFDCGNKPNPPCVGGGKRFEMNFVQGKKYRLRLINTSLYANFRFAIDGHNLTVIAADFVPVVPFTTDNVAISMAQRYDVIIEANAKPDNYWLRPIWQRSCCDNDYWNNTLGIVRYDSQSTALPTTTNVAVFYPDNCDDLDDHQLIPYVPLKVPAPSSVTLLNIGFELVPAPAGALFTINESYVWVNWSAPTNLMIAEKDYSWENSPYPATYATDGFTDYDTVPIPGNQWVYFALQDISRRNRSHPFHLHGHDFFVLAQGPGNFSASTPLQLDNPVRRDVATVPKSGHMVMAFKTDNPGSWLFHCHITPHVSQGLGLQFVEAESQITSTFKNKKQLVDTCASWTKYWNADTLYIQEDAGL